MLVAESIDSCYAGMSTVTLRKIMHFHTFQRDFTNNPSWLSDF
jgi:hypothetical protein